MIGGGDTDSMRAGIIVALLMAAVGGAGVWYVTVYDTAAAKCERGDLGACTVVAAQAEQNRAEALASDAAAEEDRRLDLAAIDSCRLYLPTDDAYVTIHGMSAPEACQEFINQGRGDRWDWTTETRPDAMQLAQSNRLVCREDYGYQMVSVYDSGGAIIGSAVCENLIYQLIPVPDEYER